MLVLWSQLLTIHILIMASSCYRRPAKKVLGILRNALKNRFPAAVPKHFTKGLSKPVKTADYRDLYADHLIRIVGDTDLSGVSIAVDCGHGATSDIAPYVMNKLGVSCVKLHTEPNGHNINQASGSTHPEVLQRRWLGGIVTRIGI
ncbi:MAG: hypothetical protein Ct9H300mP25_07270 [Acidobacteriota bacterium]|nr:MAG: hypothetical protein Ct9H300mP25_07270 [Acidobacteriota bacterium]